MIRFEDLIEKVRAANPGADTEPLRKAYVFSALQHKGQVRRSGEPYLVHPLEVADILADLRLDVVGAVRRPAPRHRRRHAKHDRAGPRAFWRGRRPRGPGRHEAEQPAVRLERGASGRKFPQDAPRDGRRYPGHPRQAGRPPAQHAHAAPPAGRTAPADCAGNPRHLCAHRAPARHEQAEERARGTVLPAPRTPSVPGAARGGGCDAQGDRGAMEALKAQLAAQLGASRRFPSCRSTAASSVSGRSTRSCAARRSALDQVYDFVALRIIPTTPGLLRRARHHAPDVAPVPGRFKDFIAMSRPNGYQSLHTSVVGELGMPFEVQIRTEEMHRVAEEGIAAHWKYKEGRPARNPTSSTSHWLRQLLEMQKDVRDPHEFMQNLRIELYPEDVYIFTPKGEVKSLPRGSTPVDFAYSSTPMSVTGARARGSTAAWCRCAPAPERRHRRDRHAAGHTPSRDWLNFVVTSRARSKIRHFIHGEETHAQHRSRPAALRERGAAVRRAESAGR